MGIESNQAKEIKRLIEKITRYALLTGFAILVVAFSVFNLLQNPSLRNDVTVSTFVEVMRENGYEIHNFTYILEPKLGDCIELVLIAKIEGSEYQFEVIVFTNTRSARAFFEFITEDLQVDNVESALNYDIIQVSIDDHYHHIIRVADMIILADGNESYKEHIQAMFELLENSD